MHNQRSHPLPTEETTLLFHHDTCYLPSCSKLFQTERYYCGSIFQSCLKEKKKREDCSRHQVRYIIADIRVFVVTTTRRQKGRDLTPSYDKKPLHQQKCQKGKVTTQTMPQKSSITQRLRTDLGRSIGVTTATQLVWLTGLRANLPTPRTSRVIKRTYI